MIRKLMIVAALLVGQINKATAMDLTHSVYNSSKSPDLGTFEQWSLERETSGKPLVNLAVRPKNPLDEQMMTIKFYYTHHLDENALESCNDYLKMRKKGTKPEYYERIGHIYFDLAPKFPHLTKELLLKSIDCFRDYMRLSGTAPQTNRYNYLGMAYTELGTLAQKSEDPIEQEYRINAVRSFDAFFETIMVFSAHDYKAAACAYNNVSSYNISGDYRVKSVTYWDLFFKFASPEMIQSVDYEKAALCVSGVACLTTDLDQQNEYWAQSKAYWEESTTTAFPETLKNKALTYYYNAMHTNLGDDFRKSALYWNLYMGQLGRSGEVPTLREIGNILFMNQKAASLESDPEKANRFLKKVHDLMKAHNIHSVYQVGDIVVICSNPEIETITKQSPLSITLPYQIEPTQEEISTLDTPSFQAQESPEITKGADQTNIMKEEIPQTHDPMPIEETFDEEEKEPDTVTIEKEFSDLDLTGAAPKKETKKDKKLRQMLERTRQRKDASGAELPQEERVHTIDPLTAFQIKKAYQENHAERERALQVLDEVLSFSQGVDGRKVAASLEKIKKYFSVAKNETSDETVILGHDISQFFYHRIHKSGADNSWKPGMVVRLKNFVRDIKITFEAIMAS